MWYSPFDPNIESCTQTDTYPMETQIWTLTWGKQLNCFLIQVYWNQWRTEHASVTESAVSTLFCTFCARTGAGRICILSYRRVPYQARNLGTSHASHDVSFHSMHKMMCLAVCRRSLIDCIAVMKENLLPSKTCTFWCEVYLDLPVYLVSLWCVYQFLRSCTLQTVGRLTYRKWRRREQCEPKMDIQASCDV